MTPQSLKIFHRKKGVYIDPYQWILLILTILLFSISYLDSRNEYESRIWIIGIGITWFLYFLAFIVSNFFREQKEIGEYRDELIFWKDKIQVGKLEIELEEISKLDFIRASDIQGRYKKGYPTGLGPYISNGLDNFFVLRLKNGKEISDNFQQTEWRRLKLFREVLIHYYQVGILEWLQLLDILGIKDYGKIKQFKEEIKTMPNNGYSPSPARYG